MAEKWGPLDYKRAGKRWGPDVERGGDRSVGGPCGGNQRWGTKDPCDAAGMSSKPKPPCAPGLGPHS